MDSLLIRDMQADDEYFVASCSHAKESDQLDKSAQDKLSWLHSSYNDGVRAKVALVDGKRMGFLYIMPIEICPVEPLGKDLMSIPCLFVSYEPTGSGIGRALLYEAEKEAKLQGKPGIATIGNYTDFWFMPGSFFEKCGYSVVRRLNNRAVMWKVFNGNPEPPSFFQPNANLSLVPDKVVVDLFWMTFCGAGDQDIVREVIDEFDNNVILRKHCVDDRKILLKHQINRGLFVNGDKVEWNFENPKEGIRAAIVKAKNTSFQKENT